MFYYVGRCLVSYDMIICRMQFSTVVVVLLLCTGSTENAGFTCFLKPTVIVVSVVGVSLYCNPFSIVFANFTSRHLNHERTTSFSQMSRGQI